MTRNQAVDEHEQTVAEVRRTAREQVVPARAQGTSGHVDRGMVAALASSGLLPRIFP
ncbi:MAG: acyl-CoA dehydrogenase, partial [Luteitalea sp.]|nr:acyl-CoA dehydrogenase [Luteitalea sp.]